MAVMAELPDHDGRHRGGSSCGRRAGGGHRPAGQDAAARDARPAAAAPGGPARISTGIDARVARPGRRPAAGRVRRDGPRSSPARSRRTSASAATSLSAADDPPGTRHRRASPTAWPGCPRACRRCSTPDGRPLSNNEIARLAIARAIAGRPRLLLIDGHARRPRPVGLPGTARCALRSRRRLDAGGRDRPRGHPRPL